MTRLETDREIDLAFDLAFNYIKFEHWAAFDFKLMYMPIPLMSTPILLCWLTSSSWVSDRLQYREQFYNRVKEELLTRYDEKRVERLLVGLE